MKAARHRFFILLTSLVITVGLCPAVALAVDSASAFENELSSAATSSLVAGGLTAHSVETDFTIADSGSGVEITGYTGEGGTVDIPSSIGGKSVVSIGEAAFVNKANITSVSIPSSVKTIGNGAFANCSGITAISLAEGVAEIGDYAFQGTGISSIAIPASVTALGRLGDRAAFVFYGCTSLAQVSVVSGNASYKDVDDMLLSKDGTKLFYCPHALARTRASVPPTVKAIADYAFFQNRSLMQVDIPSSVTSLGEWCFCQSALTSAAVPASVSYLGSGVFDNCHSLVSLDCQTVAEQPYRMCEGCSSLSSVKLSNGLRSIGFRAFKGCSGLESVSIPATVETVGNTAFYECTSLTSISLPDSVKSVEMSAFCYCENLATIDGGSSVERIGAYAFAYTSVSSFPWSSKLRFVSKDAFTGCGNFENPNVPSYLLKSATGDYLVYDDAYVISGTEDYAKANEVFALVNNERAAEGLSRLQMDSELQAAAMKRAAEISLLFEHTRPTGESCYSASAKMSGENIAAGSSTASGVMNQWMNSSGHKANILNSDFRSIGIGCIKVGAITYWVQCFGSDDGSNTQAGSGTKAASHRVDVNYDTISLSRSGFNLNQALASPYVLAAGSTLSLCVGIVNAGWPRTYCSTDSSSYTWKSSNPLVARVSKDGVVTPGTVGGTATITATTAGGKSWSIDVQVKQDLSIATVSVASGRAYTGKAQTPSPTVKIAGKTLRAGIDYEIAYLNNVNAGMATVTITGKGEYVGSKQTTFAIAKAPVAIPKAAPRLVYDGGRKTGVASGLGYSVKGNVAKNAGKYTATLTTDANYVFKGGKTTIKVKWSIARAPQKITAKNAAASLRAKKSGKSKALAKNATVNLKKKAKVSAKTAVAYKKIGKAGGKRIAVNEKTGRVTLKKGLKAGTYKFKVRLTAPKNKNYKAAKAKVITLTVKVK